MSRNKTFPESYLISPNLFDQDDCPFLRVNGLRLRLSVHKHAKETEFFYRSQALLTCADHVEKVVTATPPIHFHTGYTTHSHIKNRLTIQVAYGFYVDISNNDSNKSCLLPAGGVTVDFLTLLMRLEAVEWLLGRLFESDLVLWSRSTESAFKELNR